MADKNYNKVLLKGAQGFAIYPVGILQNVFLQAGIDATTGQISKDAQNAKDYIDSLATTLDQAIQSNVLTVRIVQALPQQNIQKNCIYQIPKIQDGQVIQGEFSQYIRAKIYTAEDTEGTEGWHALGGTGGASSGDITIIIADLQQLKRRVAALQVATKVDVTGTADTSIIKDYDTNTQDDVHNYQIRQTYMPQLSFQGQQLGRLAKSINFIGIGDVSVDAQGNVTIRLGQNLNCSLWGGTDGISNAAVTSAKSGDTAGTPSADYTTAVSSSKRIFAAGDTITAKTGATATTAAGANKNNGNEAHFNTNTKSYFLVNIIQGTNTTATTYRVGPITTSTTYSGKDAAGNTNAGISCAITNFGEQAKKATGATGYSGNVAFTFTPASMFSASTDFKLVSIVQADIDDAGTQTQSIKNVATWTNTTTNGQYFYLKENTIKATAPASVSYDFGTVKTKVISGVTYITTQSKFTVSAQDLANIGYPAADGTYAKIVPTGGTWFTSFNETATSAFTTYTTVKDTVMDYTSVQKSPLIGKWSAPQLTVAAHNYNGDSAAVASAQGIKLLVCDSSGYVTASHGSFAAVQTLADGALAVYDGRLVYPTALSFDGYNQDIVTGLTQPDYSGDTTARSYTKQFTLTGTTPSCKITLTHAASIQSAINAGTFKVQIRTVSGAFKDVKAAGLMQSTSSFAAGTSTLDVVFDAAADYPTAASGTAVRITMSSAVAQIKSITLA